MEALVCVGWGVMVSLAGLEGAWATATRAARPVVTIQATPVGRARSSLGSTRKVGFSYRQPRSHRSG